MLRWRRDRLTAPWMVLLALLAGITVVRAGDLEDYYGFQAMEILKLEWEIGPLLAADLNGDSHNDLIVCNNRKARIELLLQRPGFDPSAVDVVPEPSSENINDLFGREADWRFKRFPYPLNVKATSLAVGDFNHDERPDLAYYCDEGLRVVLQSQGSRASETLVEQSWETETRFDVRDGLKTSEALAAGDVNGDGRTDLVLLMRDGYYVLLQTGEGRLARPVRHYSSSTNLRQVEIGDVDGNGRADLVLLTAEQEEHPLRIRLQNADGGLGAEGMYAIPAPSFLRLCWMESLGRQTIASVSRQTGRFSMHVLAREQEKGEVVSIHPLPSDDEAAKRDMVCADVDGDGLADMVVTDPSRGQFLVLRGQPETGLGPSVAYPGLKGMQKICAARLDDSEGDTLVVLSVDEKLIALSRFESGRLRFPQTVPVEGEPQAMDVADLDGNGEPDLAYVAKGRGDEANTFFLRSILSVGRPAARPGPSLKLTQVEDKPLDLTACDIDHDGDVDLIVVRSYDPLLLLRQTDSSAFEQQAEDRAHIGLVSNLSPRALSLAPLGSDGATVLLVALGDFARSLYFDAEKGWQIIDQYHAADGRRQIRVAAALPAPSGGAPGIVGYDDLSGIVSFMDPQPDGTYRVGREINVGATPVRKIVSGRFRSGTACDPVLCGERKLIYIRTGVKRGLRQIAGFETNIEGGRFGHFVVGDANGDNAPDVVLTEQSRHHVQILSFGNDTQLTDACTFKVFEAHALSRERQQGRGPVSNEPRQVLVEDVTGDGRHDLVLLVHDRIIVYPQDY